MAAGFLRDLAGDRFEVVSAGYEPAESVCVEAIEAMHELGIDISGKRPTRTDELLGQRMTFVIAVCDRQKERSCPIFHGAMMRLTWPIEDPLQIQSPEERKMAVRQIRDEIRRRVLEFISEHA
jgi:arsenate reductase